MDYHEIRKALKKQNAKKVIIEDNYYYCPDCGQKLDWSEEENDGEINNS